MNESDCMRTCVCCCLAYSNNRKHIQIHSAPKPWWLPSPDQYYYIYHAMNEWEIHNSNYRVAHSHSFNSNSTRLQQNLQIKSIYCINYDSIRPFHSLCAFPISNCWIWSLVPLKLTLLTNSRERCDTTFYSQWTHETCIGTVEHTDTQSFHLLYAYCGWLNCWNENGWAIKSRDFVKWSAHIFRLPRRLRSNYRNWSIIINLSSNHQCQYTLPYAIRFDSNLFQLK